MPGIPATPMKYAVVHGLTVRQVAAYLPANYEVVPNTFTVTPDRRERIGIRGSDVAGWTMEDYIIPRLASGLYTVEQCRTLDHVYARTTGVMD